MLNRIQDAEEAARANPGPTQLVEAPDEFSQLDVRRFPSGAKVRGPLDMTQTLRRM